MMPLVPYGSLGLNERPMLLLWVECGMLVSFALVAEW